MFDFSKLRGRIVEKYKTLTAFAEVASYCNRPNALSRRLSGETPFRGDEIYETATLLDIAPEDIGLYFFTPKVR